METGRSYPGSGKNVSSFSRDKVRGVASASQFVAAADFDFFQIKIFDFAPPLAGSARSTIAAAAAAAANCLFFCVVGVSDNHM